MLRSLQVDRAIGCFRRAASVKGVDRASREGRLDYRLRLGIALGRIGRLRHAEKELRRGLRERLAFYGDDHPGYAVGLEPLAELLLRKGDLRQARELADLAVGVLAPTGHERAAGVVALRAVIVARAGTGEPPFAGLERLPDPAAERVLAEVVGRLGPDPASGLLLAATAEALVQRLGAGHRGTVAAFSAIADRGRDLGDPASRVRAIERMIAAHDGEDRQEEALAAELALARALDDAGDADGALRTYERAFERAGLSERPEVRGRVLREWGLALLEAGSPLQAEKRLTAAVSETRRGADPDLFGRASVALGLLLLHDGRTDRARVVLEQGLTGMDPQHPDTITGQAHLSALEHGRACDCK
jgi:tetratricopeptide (TPR) repeat protein